MVSHSQCDDDPSQPPYLKVKIIWKGRTEYHYDDGSYNLFKYGSFFLERDFLYDRFSCNETETYSGQAQYTSQLNGIATQYSGGITNSEDGSWDEGGRIAMEILYGFDDWPVWWFEAPDYYYEYEVCSSNEWSAYGSAGVQGSNYLGAASYEYTVVWSEPYTDEMLRQDVIALIPPYPEGWMSGSGVAFWSLSDDHLVGSGGRMLNRFTVWNTEKDVTYRVKWQELITYKNGTVRTREKQKVVQGTGDPNNPPYVEDEVDVPEDECSISVLADSIQVEVVPLNNSGGSPGSGMVGNGNGGCSGQACSSDDIVPEGPSLWISLGTADLGGADPDPELGFSSSDPRPELYTPQLLSCSWPDQPGVDVVRAEVYKTNFLLGKDAFVISNYYFKTNIVGTNIVVITNTYYSLEVVDVTNLFVYTNVVIRQVRTGQVLADVVTVSPEAYEIRVYRLSQVGQQKIDGLYPILDTNPFVTWRIENPNPGSTNQLRITESRPSQGIVRRWNYTYTPETSSWKLQPLEGEVEIESSSSTNGDLRQVRTIWRKPGGADVLRVKRTYQKYSTDYQMWDEVLVEEAIGAENAPKITTYTYYDVGAFGVSGRRLLETVTYPDNSWTYYAGYNSNGNPTMVYSSFGDATLDDYWNGRLTEYYYGAGYGDDGTINPYTPRKVVESVQGQVISCRYTLFPSIDVRLDIQCTKPDAAWDDPSNLFTTNRYYSSGPNQFRLKAVVHPDGTLTAYDYTTNATGTLRTNIVAHGAPNPTYTAVVDGTVTYTVITNSGYYLMVETKDIATGITLSRDVYSNFDEFGRPRRVTHLDGTYEDTQYSTCCGTVDSTTDRDGVLTQYFYDAAGRQTGYWKVYGANVITYTNVLDAAGRVLQTIRIAGGSQVPNYRVAYDLAGRLVAETNALGGVTTYAETTDPVTGGLIRTSTYPDGGTRIETYYHDGSLKRLTGTAVMPVRYEYGVEYLPELECYCTFEKEIKLNPDGTDTSEWVKTYTDMLGRQIKIVYADSTPETEADNPTARYFYNNRGQLWKQIDPDGVTTLYFYNNKGELEYTVVDMDCDDEIDWAGPDRITRTVRTVVGASGNIPDRIRTDTYVWDDNQTQGTLVSTTETSTDGLKSWHTTWNNNQPVTTYTETTYGTDGTRTVTTVAPDQSYTISIYRYGRLESVTRYDANGAQLSKTTYTYDSHGRQWKVTDARNGTTTYTYNNADLVQTVTTPDPDGAGPATPQVTTYYYNKMLQITNVIQPDGTSVRSEYYPNGLLKKTWGSRTYPVEYTYDYAGRMKTMTTWQQFNHTTGQGISGAATTTWNYDPYRGWLISKVYHGNSPGPTYTYTPAGRLKTRTWARTVGGSPLVTTYNYNYAGELESVVYSDATPDVSYTYDRRGRVATITQGSGVTSSVVSYTYNNANQLLSESYTGGPLDGLSVTNEYDELLRRTNLAVLNGATPLTLSTYSYDAASRLLSVSDGTNSATYSYLANSPLVSQINFSNKVSGQWHLRMRTTKQYDYLNRLTFVGSTPGSGVGNDGPSLPSFTYTYNNANQRVRVVLADGSYWLYEYDSLGQVISGKRYWSDGTPVAGQQFEYSFDHIGNRTQTRTGGDENGWNLRTATYTANLLNQYTTRTVPGYIDIIGVALATKPVYVNNQLAYRKGEYFRKELSVNNASAPVWQSVIVEAPGEQSVGGHVFVPKTPEQFGYDADGNMTNDGRWSFTWDAENRLVKVESRADTPQTSWRRVEWTYDGKGRRIRQTTSVWANSAWLVIEDLKFIADPMSVGRHIVELNATNNSLVRSYVWGLDLSGSLDGVGGVGGLLWVVVGPAGPSGSHAHFCSYDGNGNVVGLVSANTGTETARYEYGPFGEPIRVTGQMAKENPFRFSTKRTDNTTDLVLYEYRAYNPSLGCWLSRDPIGEKGGVQLYAFVGNAPSGNVELLGLYTVKVKRCEVIVLVGHGAADKPHEFIFTHTCAAGHFVGCYSRYTNDRIPEGYRVPGAPSADGEVTMTPAPEGTLDPHEDFYWLYRETMQAAKSLAKSLCKRADGCGCRYIYVKTKLAGSWIDPSNWKFPSESYKERCR